MADGTLATQCSITRPVGKGVIKALGRVRLLVMAPAGRYSTGGPTPIRAAKEGCNGAESFFFKARVKTQKEGLYNISRAV